MYWPCSRAHGALLCHSSRSFCGPGEVEEALSVLRRGSSFSSWRKCPSTRPRRLTNTSSITCKKDKRCHNHWYVWLWLQKRAEPITHARIIMTWILRVNAHYSSVLYKPWQRKPIRDVRSAHSHGYASQPQTWTTADLQWSDTANTSAPLITYATPNTAVDQHE